MRFWRLGMAGVLACSTWSTAASAGDGGAAQALFDKAVADLNEGHAGTACPAFAESQRLDPRPGTLFALADCEVALGLIASALGHYHEYVGWVSRLPQDSQARHAERVSLARAQIEALQPKVPTLTLALSPSAPAGLVIERDGVPLQGAALGVALPIDPGEHVIVAHAPGMPEERITVRIEAGESKRLEFPTRPSPPPSTAPPVTEQTKNPDPPAEPQPVDEASSQKTLGYVAGGVGVVGIIVGTITGVLVLDRKATVDEECNGTACRSAEGKKAADSGQTLAAVSTIAFGVGLAGLATGVTLVLTAPDQKNRGAWLSVTKEF
jgi:hypothetical protein